MSIKSELVKLADKLDQKKKFAQANEIDKMIQDIDPDSLSYEDDLADISMSAEDIDDDAPSKEWSTKPSGMALLLVRLDIASLLSEKFPGMSPVEIAEELGLGDNKDVVDLIKQLESPFYAEGWGARWRSRLGSLKSSKKKELSNQQSQVQQQTPQVQPQSPTQSINSAGSFLKEEPVNAGKKAAWYEQKTPDGTQLLIIEVGSDGKYPTRQTTPEGAQYIYPMKKIVAYGRNGYKVLTPEEAAKFGNYSNVYIISEPA